MIYGDALLSREESRTEHVNLGNSVGSHVDERDLFDDLAGLSVPAQTEAPVEPVPSPDLFVTGLQHLEVGGAGEPAFEAPGDLVTSRAEFRPAGQEQSRLRGRCQRVSESVEVAR